MKLEFSKVLIFIDYCVFLCLIIMTLCVPEVDFITLDVAWIAQLGVSTGFYYWKTRSDNRVKVPVAVIKSMPPNMRAQIDLSEIITEILRQSN